ncbi:MAG: hypothetical protein ACRDSS_14710, partial [Actinocrinis sp.]
MYVLHALFTDAGCWELWAEDSNRPLVDEAYTKSKSTGPAKGTRPSKDTRRSKDTVARRHPFAADPAVLAGLLRAAGEEIADTVRRVDVRGSVPVALPSHASGPLPSASFARFVRDTDLAAGSRSGSGRGRQSGLRAWIVPTLVLEPRDGAALLAALDGDQLATFDADGAEADIPLAESVRFARAVAQFADVLVRRGEMLPDLEVDDERTEHHAVWRPIYALDSAAHRKALIDAMPPVFRAQLL